MNCVSDFKVFGYPSGMGCLIARKAALAKLKRPWYACGTITISSVQGDGHYLAEGEAGFEDGTVNYLNLPAVEIGLRHIASVGIDTIHERVMCLTGWLIDRLTGLRHATGQRMLRLHGPRSLDRRGGTVTITFFDRNGLPIDDRRVEELANRANISLRTGCFCNPGAGETALGISKPELVACFMQLTDRLTLDDFRVCIDGKSSGAVRVSVGLVSNFADVYRFVQFAESLLV